MKKRAREIFPRPARASPIARHSTGVSFSGPTLASTPVWTSNQ